MVDLKTRRKTIEQKFTLLESFWADELPDAIASEGSDDFDMLDFVSEARSIPFDQYKWLIKLLGDDLKAEYSERLAKLDALIAKNEPALKELLKSG